MKSLWTGLFALSLLLAGCGGGGSSAQPTPADDEPDPVESGSGTGSGSDTLSCSDSFSLERLLAGEDCSSKAGDYCGLSEGGFETDGEVAACDGVSISSVDITTASGMSSHYLVLQGAEAPETVYLALHYLGGRVEAFANVIRLQELAKQRRALVIVPQAPGLLGELGLDLLGSRWPTQPELEPVTSYVQFLDDVVADARSRYSAVGLPLLVAGFSNGGTMAYNYACASADHIDAVLATAANMSNQVQRSCQPSRSIGTVIVHGTADLLNPYDDPTELTLPVPAIHQLFETFSSCAGDDGETRIDPSEGTALPVIFDASTKPCTEARRHYLVTVRGGGHNWPGQLHDIQDMTLDLIGLKSSAFDATLQGYDLLKQAAGL
jgi:poly(3-hydroxybutyrate) depolymerase